MPEVKQISAAYSRGGQKKRVAVYCRVSTNSADQQMLLQVLLFESHILVL